MKNQPRQLPDLVPHWGALVDMTRDLVRSMSELSRHQTGSGGIIDEESCRSLYSEVTAGMETLFEDGGADRPSAPHLVVRDRLNRLPRQLSIMYLLLTPCVILLMIFTFFPDRGGMEGEAAPWITGFVTLFLLALPLLFYRHRRAEIIRNIKYLRRGNSGSRILIDRAPAPQVLRNLAGAAARHFFWEIHGAAGYPSWVREGWIRLAQWALVRECCRSRGDSAGLGLTLEDITEELKCAVVLVSSVIGVRPPAELRRTHSRYSTTSIGSFVTGKPLADRNDLVERSLGTACFFLAHRSFPEHEILNNPGLLLNTFSR